MSFFLIFLALKTKYKFIPVARRANKIYGRLTHHWSIKYGVGIREVREAPVIEPIAKTIAPGLMAAPRIHGDPKSAIKKAKAESLFYYRSFIIFIYDYRIFNICCNGYSVN